MHLKFDHAWFSYVFVGPLLVAIGLAVALLALGHLGTIGVPPPAPGERGWRRSLDPEVVLALEATVVAYLSRSAAPAAVWLGTAAVRARAAASFAAPEIWPAWCWRRSASGPSTSRSPRSMLQHLVLILVVPAPVAPRPVAVAPLAPVARGRIVGRLAGGSPGGCPPSLASLIQIAWHVPAAFDAALRVERFHALEHLSFLASGLLVWWPVAGPTPEWPRLRPAWPAPLSLPRDDPDDGDRHPDHARRGRVYPYYAAAGAAWPPSGRGRTRSSRASSCGSGGMLGYLVAGAWCSSRCGRARGARRQARGAARVRR